MFGLAVRRGEIKRQRGSQHNRIQPAYNMCELGEQIWSRIMECCRVLQITVVMELLKCLFVVLWFEWIQMDLKSKTTVVDMLHSPQVLNLAR